MNILFEDDSIIVVKKDAGEAVQSAKASAQDVVSKLKLYLSKTGKIKGEPYLGIIHRLDQPVEGVVVFAKTKEAASNLSKQFQTDIPHKHYKAVVEGTIQTPIGENHELDGYIYKDAKENKAHMAVSPDQKTSGGAKIQNCSLVYSVTGFGEGLTYLDIVLKTGRFHQIRAQLSNIGYPIVGDRKYGSKIDYGKSYWDENNMPKGAIALRADVLELSHPITKKKIKFEL